MPLVTRSATDSFSYGDVAIGGLPGPLQAVPKFPLSPSSTRDLLSWSNVYPSSAAPTLLSNIADSDTTINLGVGTGAILPTDNFEVSIDDEIIFVAARAGDVLSGCVRGVESSTNEPHLAGSTVQLLITALSHNQLVAEIVELEQYLASVPIEFVIPSTTRGDFQIAHGLSRVPRRAIPVSDSAGLIRLQNPVRFDATYIYLNASDDGLTGFVEVWP